MRRIVVEQYILGTSGLVVSRAGVWKRNRPPHEKSFGLETELWKHDDLADFWDAEELEKVMAATREVAEVLGVKVENSGGLLEGERDVDDAELEELLEKWDKAAVS